MLIALRKTSGITTALPRFIHTPPARSATTAQSLRKSAKVASPIAPPEIQACISTMSVPRATGFDDVSAQSRHHLLLILHGGEDSIAPAPQRRAGELIRQRLHQLIDGCPGPERFAEIAGLYLAGPVMQTVRSEFAQVELGE